MIPGGTPVRSKPYKGLGMEGAIATWYARNTRRDVRRYQEGARIVRERVAPGGRVLEVAPGPGYLSIEVAKSGPYQVTGLDVSRSFVRIARENAERAGVAVDFRHGDVAHMPFAEGAFDLVVCVAAFKNFADPLGALDEMYRVLRPGGEAVVQDLRKDVSLAEVDDEVRRMGLSRLNAALTRLTFRTVLLQRAYTRTSMEALVARSRFGSCSIAEAGVGFDCRMAKSA